MTERAARVLLLLLDCDGVLTDGRITLVGADDELKSFHTRDGLGLTLLHRAGLRSGIISGRASASVTRRARELGVTYVHQGASDKVSVYESIIAESGLTDTDIAYAGDDLPDIPLLRRAGLALAVADAPAEVLAHAHYVTHLPGGFGAVREICELILKAQGRWEE